MSEQNPTPWELSADEVLAVALRNAEAFQVMRYELGLSHYHMPSGPRKDTYQAVSALHRDGVPVHIAALVDRCDGRVSAEWIAERATAYSDAMLGERLRSTVEIVKARALAYHQLTAMELAAQQLRASKDETERRAIVGELITDLGQDTGHGIQDATAVATAKRFLDMMDAPPPPTLTTGLSWLDNVTGGLQRKQIWWIAAAYKKRKSTLMRNMVIGLLRKGASVTIAAREGSQELVVAQIVAMLAVENLYKNDCHNARDKRGVPLNQLSATLLLALRNTYKTVMDPRQVAAISVAVHEYRRWENRIRIYDTSAANGGLGDFASLETVIARDVAMYGVDVVFVDYFGLFDAGRGSIYENTSYMAQRCQAIAVEKDLVMVMLAQLNEESVKGHNDSHSPGVKGGGDPAATADFLLETDYPKNSEGEPVFDRLRVKVKLSRHGEFGRFTDVPMNPASGLILPTVEIVDLLDNAGGAR